jgi:hypothetical protein
VPRIGEILVELGACTEAEVRQGLENQVIFGGRLGTNLLELGSITEEELARGLGRRHGRPCLFGDLSIDPAARAMLSAGLAERLEAVPYLVQDRKLAVLVCNPDDLAALDELAFATGKRVHPIVIPEARMWALMRRFYGVERQLRGLEPPKQAAKRAPPAAGATKDRLGHDLMDEAGFQSLYGRIDSVGPPPVTPPMAASSPSPPPPLQEEVVDLTDLIEPVPEAAREAVLTALSQEEGSHAPRPDFTPPQPVPAARVPEAPLGFAEAVRSLEGVADRQSIARTVLRYARGRFKRAVLLTVQRGAASGWEGLGDGLDPQVVRRVHVALQGHGVLETVVSSHAHFLGPLQKTEQNLRFLKALDGGAPRNAFVVPILALGRVANLLYLDNGRGSLVDASDVGELLILAAKIAQSYDALVRRASGPGP